MRSSVAVAVTALAATMIAVPLASASAKTATPTVAPAATAPAQVRLITGDTVAVSTVGGKQKLSVNLLNRSGLAGQSTTLRSGADTYLIPGAARRYLDTVLDRSLFDVTALAKTTSTQVTLATTAGAKPNVPGLTVTARTSTSESGYLDAAGARAFGRALAVQAIADSKAHRITRSLFGGVTHISAAGSVVVAKPAFQQYTLQIKVLDTKGKPVDFALLALTNVQDGAKLNTFTEVVDGLAKISVPVGPYSGLAEFDNISNSGAGDDSYLIPVEEFHVTKNDQVMVFDARKATTTPSVRTPRPAGLVSEMLEWDRGTASSSNGFGANYGTGSTVHVAPTDYITDGTLDWVTHWALAANPSSGTPYSYDVAFHDSGLVPADQSHTVAAFQFAQLNSRYYTDGQSRLALFGRGVSYPFEFFVSTYLFPLPTPLARTEYVYGPTDAKWSASLVAAPTDDDPFQGFISDGLRLYSGGSTQTVDWLRGPLAPGIQAAANGDDFYICNDCRTSDQVGVFFSAFADTTPAHFGSFDLPDDNTIAARFQLYRNGKLIDDEPNTTGGSGPATSATATYRALATTHRSLVGFATSTKTVEDVTFRSGATTGNPTPAGWFCFLGDGCTVLPLLQASVPLPTDLTGTMPLGASTFTFTVNHVQGAVASAVSGVTFGVSTNGGSTYHLAPVTSLGSGRFQVTLNNAASSAGHGIGIQISASDAAGGKLIETVQNAYFVAAS